MLDSVRVVSPLPCSVLLAGWLDACLDGRAPADDLAAALTAYDETLLHVVEGLDTQGLSPVLALGALRRAGATGARCALPVPGDPVGLAGPPAFNEQALDAGEAVVVVGAGLGLVPTRDGDVVTWRAVPAERPRPLDPFQAAQDLRVTLSEATHRLVALDVARWEPEVVDVLQNVRHRTPTRLPPGVDPRLAEALDRALLCREVVALARASDGAAVSTSEADERRRALDPLDRAARHALVAALAG